REVAGDAQGDRAGLVACRAPRQSKEDSIRLLRAIGQVCSAVTGDRVGTHSGRECRRYRPCDNFLRTQAERGPCRNAGYRYRISRPRHCTRRSAPPAGGLLRAFLCYGGRAAVPPPLLFLASFTTASPTSPGSLPGP